MTYDPATYWPARYAEQGETYVAKGGTRESFELQRALITPMLAALPTPGRVLDFGCGTGRFREALEAHGLDYDGFDLIPGLGTVDDIEYGAYDVVVAIYVLQHIVDADQYINVLERIHAGLKPGGVFFVIDANPGVGPAHMRPRGPESVSWMFGGPSWHSETFDNHWVGTFTKAAV